MTGAEPRLRIEREAARRGRAELAAACVRLLRGEDVEPAVVVVLGGGHGERVLAGDRPVDRYWLRVWAARGLLWCWDVGAVAGLAGALRDPHWRVREMAAKVVARHLVGDLLAATLALRDDPVPRVRAAADRAVARLTTSGA